MLSKSGLHQNVTSKAIPPTVHAAGWVILDNLNKQYNSPRKIEAPSNRFDTPILKIRGRHLIDTTPESSSGTTTPAAASFVTLVDEIAYDTQMNDHTLDPVPQWFQPQAAAPASVSGHPLGLEFGVNSGFEAPSFDFDLDLFSETLEQEPIPVPTGAELAAHAFLRTVLGLIWFLMDRSITQGGRVRVFSVLGPL